jgi:hypothetical protein
MHKIIELAKKSWQLDGEIMKLMRFKLHHKQLENDDSEVFLFKTHLYQKKFL